MVQQSTARYRFHKRFRVSADEAYGWLTDFQANDLELMGGEGRREVRRLTPDVYLLVDHVRRGGKEVLKEKLFHLYPEDRAWISTYVGGPTNRSQFLYQVEPAGRNRSRFTFTGLQMEQGRRALKGVPLARYARRLRDEDSATWTRLTWTLHRELARSRRAKRR